MKNQFNKREYPYYNAIIENLYLKNENLADQNFYMPIPKEEIDSIISTYIHNFIIRHAESNNAPLPPALDTEEAIAKYFETWVLNLPDMSRNGLYQEAYSLMRKKFFEFNDVLMVKDFFPVDVADYSSNDERSSDDFSSELSSDDEDSSSEHSTSICSNIVHYAKSGLFKIGCASTALGIAYYADINPLVTIGSVVIGAGLHYVATQTEHNADNVFVAR